MMHGVVPKCTIFSKNNLNLFGTSEDRFFQGDIQRTGYHDELFYFNKARNEQTKTVDNIAGHQCHMWSPFT